MIVLDQYINNNIKQGKGDKMNFNNDFDALKFLKSREYTEKHGVILSIKTPDDEEWDAINYLFHEWDYSYKGLSSCPFCGSKNISVQTIKPHASCNGEMFISCDCCGCSIPIHGTNLENAIDKWNERKIKI